MSQGVSFLLYMIQQQQEDEDVKNSLTCLHERQHQPTNQPTTTCCCEEHHHQVVNCVLNCVLMVSFDDNHLSKHNIPCQLIKIMQQNFKPKS